MPRGFAIDLGTANTLVWEQGRGIVLNEPTVIAVNQRSGDVLAMGREAYAMIGRTPGHIVAERPLRGGAVTDFEATAKLIALVLKKVGGGRLSRKPRVLVCVPTATTNVERRAVEEATERAGAGEAHLMEEPMAAAIGAGLPVQEPLGTMVIDIGGGTSEVAVIALGGIVASKGIKVGGFDLDASIQRHVRDKYAVAIGDRTAEEVKLAIGSASPQREALQAEVRGRELSTGLPKEVIVGAAEIREAIEDNVAAIVATILDALGECPPELTEDIIDKGVWLVGGGSLLQGLDRRIERESQVAVNHVELPLESVATGAGTVIETYHDLSQFFDG